jgi:hypothetical protein
MEKENMSRKATGAFALVLCGLFISMVLPTSAAVEPIYSTSEDAIWVEEGLFLLYDENLRTYIYIKIGYTHWDRSQMSISLLTPVVPQAPPYFVMVLPSAGWNPPYNYDDYGYIEYTFYPDESVSYWQAKGIFVSPSSHLRVHMESTTTGVMNIDLAPFWWE